MASPVIPAVTALLPAPGPVPGRGAGPPPRGGSDSRIGGTTPVPAAGRHCARPVCGVVDLLVNQAHRGRLPLQGSLAGPQSAARRSAALRSGARRCHVFSKSGYFGVHVLANGGRRPPDEEFWHLTGGRPYVYASPALGVNARFCRRSGGRFAGPPDANAAPGLSSPRRTTGRCRARRSARALGLPLAREMFAFISIWLSSTRLECRARKTSALMNLGQQPCAQERSAAA